ncbi:hypothetical protein NMB32_14385 [Stenotrophomonas sp. CD2]|nr:hypothetical protein NMB32_14385 [Stenotrophomonas sp. CD2]
MGDIVTVCNGISCVEYTWRGEQFDSGKEVSNILPPPHEVVVAVAVVAVAVAVVADGLVAVPAAVAGLAVAE